jgi:nucleoside-diphosphate-sugar epimerase
MTTLIPPHQGFLYVSTTAVYGDCAGRWITEAEPLKPSNDRGRRRLAAEHSLHAWAARSGGRAMTLRVPGIYGPGRLPLERLRRGEPMLAEADCPPANRVHVEDLADAAICIAERGISGAAYHVSDGHPSTMADYFRRCAQHFGLPEPREIPVGEARRQLSPALLSFLEESRRLDASALRALGWRPRYPGLTEGLAACS